MKRKCVYVRAAAHKYDVAKSTPHEHFTSTVVSCKNTAFMHTEHRRR
jgi:hypothetical protein